MQNRYVGDIGDFGKYGLLRSLCGVSEILNSHHSPRLGVVWYLYPDESHNSDGKYTGYLVRNSYNHARFRDCDPALYDALHQLVSENDRHINSVRDGGILLSDTTYFNHPLSYPSRQPRTARQAARENWVQGALTATAEADVIFVDPDNGLSETVDPLRKNGPKYAFTDDLRQFANRGQSLIIYHHLGRRGTAVQQIKYWAGVLQKTLSLAHLPWSLWYHRGTARAYFIIPQEHHAATLEERLTGFVSGPWGAHFELVGQKGPH